jgi:hypothetical protein
VRRDRALVRVREIKQSMEIEKSGTIGPLALAGL